MKRLILLFLLPIIFAVGCTNQSFITFVGWGNIAEPTCWIRVFGSETSGIYYDGNGTFSDVSFPINDVFNLTYRGSDIVFNMADVQVVAYTKTDDGYWFQIDMTGYRTARFYQAGKSPVVRDGEISTGQYWVNERDVIESDESIFTKGCMSLIRTGEFGSLGITRLVYCNVTIKRDETALRVGAGVNRAIRLYAQGAAIYPVLATTSVEEQLWYQLDLGSGNLLWVDANDVSPISETDRQNSIDCASLPNIDPPPIIQGTSNQIFSIEQSGDCTSFNILSPIGTVPEGESTYRWTPVDQADQYILNFSDYLGNYVTSIVVDGSQNSAVINTGSLATGSQLSFEIVAMSNNEILCRSNSGPLIRTAGYVAPEIPAPQPTREPTKEKKSGGGGYTPPET